MSKYDGLGTYLGKQFQAEVPMTFAEIERVIGAKLPPEAQTQRAWWSNNPNNNVMTKIWLAAGYETARVDVAGRKLVFKRSANGTRGPGMADEARAFRPENTGEKKPRRSPLFGAMKGTFTIEPGYDLTSPVYSNEEWAEIEKEMNADWDQIEEGLRRRP
jgi:hypothetical protein